MIDGPCPFCPPQLGRERLLDANDLAFATFDLNPVSAGHALVVPRRHVESVFDLTEAEMGSLLPLIRSVRDAVERDHAPAGYNIGWNIGEVAGQSVPHLHCHVIPRYPGDVPVPRGGIRNLLLIAGPPAHAE